MALISDSTFQSINDKYAQVKTLQKNNKSATETEASWNHEAKILLDVMEKEVDKMLEEHGEDTNIHTRLLGMKYSLWYEQAKILVNSKHETEAKGILSKALDLIKPLMMKPEMIFLALRIINHYSYLLSKEGDLEKSQAMLEQAERMYKELDSQQIRQSLLSGDDLFKPTVSVTPGRDAIDKLERLVTNNLQMLGYVHNKQSRPDHFALYHHLVLRRQLELKDMDPVIWASKVTRLASYFLSKSRYKEARNHLIAGSHILEKYEKELKIKDQSESRDIKLKAVQKVNADISKCWVKYGLSLFNVSKNRLVSLFYGEQFLDNLWSSPFDILSPNTFECGVGAQFDTLAEEVVASNEVLEIAEPSEGNLVGEYDKTGVKVENLEDIKDVVASLNVEQSATQLVTDNLIESSSVDGDEKCANKINGNSLNTSYVEDKEGESIKREPKKLESCVELTFPSLDLNTYEEQVLSTFVETTDQARALFVFTHSWLKESKSYYNLKDHPMDYVDAILDLSELYRYLAFYEEGIDSQYCVQKRRADALETLSAVLREVRPQCYLAVSVELLRELAEVQMEMMGLNLRKLYMAQETEVGGCASTTVRKMEALADMHSRLGQFGDVMGQEASYANSSNLQGYLNAFIDNVPDDSSFAPRPPETLFPEREKDTDVTGFGKTDIMAPQIP